MMKYLRQRLRQERGYKMGCPHIWKKVNEVKVCVRCGLTRTYDGRILFDKALVAELSRKEKRKKR